MTANFPLLERLPFEIFPLAAVRRLRFENAKRLGSSQG
jgi:hypothetical protein